MENLKYTEILQLNKKLEGKITTTPYKIGVLSNTTVNTFKDILGYTCRINQIEPDIELGNYDNILQDSITHKNKDLVIIFYDLMNIIEGVSDFFDDIDDVKYVLLKNKLFNEIDLIFDNLKLVPTIIFNSFSSAYFANDHLRSTKTDVFCSELNNYVKDKKTGNALIFNIDKIYTDLGLKQSIDLRFYHSSKALYTLSFYKNYCSSIENTLLKNTGKLKKAIIFDCDNTLWKGIIGEDGMEGIDMSPATKNGKFFNRIQQIAFFLSRKGVLVGICSKNNEEDVLEVMRMHKDMVLKESNVVIHKINWDNKAANLIAIASELNIGIDSLFFVDDSSFEINLIKEKLPEIGVMQVPNNIAEYPDLLLKSVYKYFNLYGGNEDAQKTEMYKQQFEREQAKKTSGSLDDYFASLNIELTIINNNLTYLQRIAQLTQKTNQFNLTTIRYTETQIEQFINDKQYQVYGMFVKDSFGDNGLTGVCILREDLSDLNAVVIDSFLMSCRIIGRNIEISFLNYIIAEIKTQGYEYLYAEFVRTKKNEQVAGFYDSFGFTVTNSTEHSKRYRLIIANHTLEEVNYIKINNYINQ